jgi:uncharacterized membrane protein YphA (DoxX/SURF4 family)
MTTLMQGWRTEQAVETIDRSRIATGITWTFQLAVAVMFLIGGATKLAGIPTMVQLFDAVGVGQWFRYVTGGVEVLSAVLLLIPRLALYGALLAAVTMACAVFTHLAIVGGSPVPAFVLFVAAGSVIWIRRTGR